MGDNALKVVEPLNDRTKGRTATTLSLQGTGQPERFRSTASATRDPRFPRQDRVQHGGALLGQLHQVGEQMAAAINLQRQSGQDGGFGLQIEFKSFPDSN